MLHKETVEMTPRRKPRIDRRGPVTGSREGTGFVVTYVMRDGKMNIEVKGRAKLQDLTRVLHQLERKWCKKNGLVNDDRPVLTHNPFSGIKIALKETPEPAGEPVGKIDCSQGLNLEVVADALRVGVEKGRTTSPPRRQKKSTQKPQRAALQRRSRPDRAAATPVPEEVQDKMLDDEQEQMLLLADVWT